jgi:hypothetical protein
VVRGDRTFSSLSDPQNNFQVPDKLLDLSSGFNAEVRFNAKPRSRYPLSRKAFSLDSRASSVGSLTSSCKKLTSLLFQCRLIVQKYHNKKLRKFYLVADYLQQILLDLVKTSNNQKQCTILTFVYTTPRRK